MGGEDSLPWVLGVPAPTVVLSPFYHFPSKTLGYYRSGHWCSLGSCSWTYLGEWLDSLWSNLCSVSSLSVVYIRTSQSSLAGSYKVTLTKPVIPSKRNETHVYIMTFIQIIILVSFIITKKGKQPKCASKE